MANDPIRIKGVGFNEYSEPDTDVITNEVFEASGQWLLLANYAIPKHTKVYMEITITQNTAIDMIRHLPLYLGVHKEPSSGILNNSCVFMSSYYSTIADFEIFEKYKHTLEDGSMIIDSSTQSVGTIQTKLPIVNSVIGLGVDIVNNTITIFNNGEEFYTLSPSTFNLADEGDWYFAIYSRQSIYVKGKLNFGRYKTAYMPDGYYTLYQVYFPDLYKSSYIKPIDEVDNPYKDHYRTSASIKATIEVTNTAFPIDKYSHTRSVSLDHSIGSGNEKESSFIFLSNRSYGKYDMSSINLVCPLKPVYCELQVVKASLNENYIGIPIEVGLTVKKNNYTSRSFRVCLYHMRGAEYQAFSVDNGEQKYYLFPSPKNPTPPIQPNTVGFVFDRYNQVITIVTGGRVFVQVPIQGISTNSINDEYYIFFKSADEVYTGTLEGYVSLGDNGLAYDIPVDELNEKVSSVYDYWNAGIYYELDTYPEIRCRMNVVDPSIEIYKDFYAQIYVPKNDNVSPGLNLLFNTHNIITNTETHHNEPDTSLDAIESMIESDGKN